MKKNLDHFQDLCQNIFEQNLDRDSSRVVVLHSSLLNASHNKEVVTKDDINKYVQEITDNLLQSAEKTLGKSNVKRNVENNTIDCKRKQLWFNEDCKKSRKEYRKAKRLFKKYGSNLFKSRLKFTETNYKKTMDKNIIKFNRQMRIKMKKNEI